LSCYLLLNIRFGCKFKSFFENKRLFWIIVKGRERKEGKGKKKGKRSVKKKASFLL